MKTKITIEEDGWVSIEYHLARGKIEIVGLGDLGVDVLIEDLRNEKDNPQA